MSPISGPNRSVNVNDFYTILMELCEETAEADEEELQESVKAAGEQAVSELKAHVWKHDYGKYNKGWKSDYSVSGDGHAKAVVHNTSQPSLTHLLENGHEMFINGKDTGKRVPAYKHIEPAYEHAKTIVERGV